MFRLTYASEIYSYNLESAFLKWKSTVNSFIKKKKICLFLIEKQDEIVIYILFLCAYKFLPLKYAKRTYNIVLQLSLVIVSFLSWKSL